MDKYGLPIMPCTHIFTSRPVNHGRQVDRSTDDKSWFNMVRFILQIYNLPSIFFLFERQMSKSELKRNMNETVHSHIEAMWRADVTEKSSLERQLAMKTPDDKSWFNMVRFILQIYNLPSIFFLFERQMSKSEWKRNMNETVHSHIEAMWRADVTEKSSLKYVNPNSLKVGKAHHFRSTVRNCLTDSKRAQLKCKLLTGTYILQGNRAAFNQYTVDPTCKLCLAAPETRQQCIAECSAYIPEREVYAEKLRNNPIFPDEPLKRDLLNPELFTQLTLDASFYINGQENLETLELHSREYILQIHKKE